jgi:type IV pilus assembly protein PilB
LPEAQRKIVEAINSLPADMKKSLPFKEPYMIYKTEPKSDCAICKGKGFSGRIGVFEIFKMTRELAEIISKGFSESKLVDEAKRQEMVTLRQDGIIKALEGKVLLEEVLIETEEYR